MAKTSDAALTEREEKHAVWVDAFYTPNQSIVKVPSRFGLGQDTYFVGVLRQKRDKKKRMQQAFFESIYRTKDLDSAIFVYNNIAWFDALGTNILPPPFGTRRPVDHKVEFDRWFTAEMKKFKPDFSEKRDAKITLFLDKPDEFYGY